nr:MAG TPA: hypothetical protein [Caudoviricetes sp.]
MLCLGWGLLLYPSLNLLLFICFENIKKPLNE